MRQESFYKNMWTIALPVTLQALLQSSFGMVDQMMIGRLGEAGIAGIGLAGKFASMYSVVLGAIAAAAGIMAAQYIGQENERELKSSFFVNLLAALCLAALFTAFGVWIPQRLLRLYTGDAAAVLCGAQYLRIYALSFVPMAIVSLLSVLLRCRDAASLPLFASLLAVGLNTGLNYVLIFGKCGFPALGVQGAAIASALSQAASLVLLCICAVGVSRRRGGIWLPPEGERDEACMPPDGEQVLADDACEAAGMRAGWSDVLADGRLEEAGLRSKGKNIFANQASKGRNPFSGLLVMDRAHRMQYAHILLPILVCEFLWSLGENIYAGIYGHMGVAACAAMTMTGCVQGLVIGALSGLSQAAGILIGKQLGDGDEEGAYRDSRRFLRCGALGSLVLSVLLVILAPAYVRIYRVEPEVRLLANQILIAFAVIAPVKVQNMILGGGIIRSGGKTSYVMCIDIIGTWVFGVPLGLLAAFVWHLSIPYVYFVLSLEEVVRLFLSLVLFRRRSWMKRL